MSRRDAALITTVDLGMDGDDCALLEDTPAPERVIHSMADILRFRMLMIAAGYEDVIDADNLRHNPAFKLTLGRLSVAAALCSQLTISRFENLPGPRVAAHGSRGERTRAEIDEAILQAKRAKELQDDILSYAVGFDPEALGGRRHRLRRMDRGGAVMPDCGHA